MGVAKPWFRFYVEALDDPKVQRLSEASFKAWVNLLCVAAKNDGKIPSLADAAYGLRLSESRTRGIVVKLVGAGLLDAVEGGYYEPHNWGERQYKHDCSTERVRKYRAGKKAAELNSAVGETAGRKHNETVSGNDMKRFPEADQSRTEQIRAEIDDDDTATPRKPAREPPEEEQRLIALAILPRLFGEFMAAMPERKGGHPKKAAHGTFRAAVLAGQDAGAIIVRARAYADEARRNGTAGTDRIMAADQWLIARPWANATPEWQRTAGYALAKTVAEIAGRAAEFEMTGWNGAAHRAQHWLNQGWPEELIISSVREQAARMPSPPNSITYFEKGIADHIARQQRPLPTGNATNQHQPLRTGRGRLTPAQRARAFADQAERRELAAGIGHATDAVRGDQDRC